MTKTGKTGTEWRLSLYTFVGVFLSMLAVGAATVPYLLGYVERHYFLLQADVNQRQVRAMSRFVESRLQAGADLETVIEEFQAAIEGTQTDRGYLCLIDQRDVRYLGHPDLAALGMSVKPNALFDPDFRGRAETRWQEYLKRGQTASGLLHFGPDMPPEIVYFASVPGTGWTLSSHENAARIQAEVRSFRRALSVGAVLLGLLLAAPASLVARGVSRRNERQVQQRSELERRVLELEHARKTQELEEARRLQLSLLPETVPEHPTVDLAAYLKTASEVGGDYYDFDVAEDGTLTVAIGDATGHGAQAGILVVATKSLFNVLVAEPDPKVALQSFSKALRRMALPRLHMCLALGKLRGHTLELAGSGMPPALVYQAAAEQVEAHPLSGMPLGSVADFPYRSTRIELAPGDTVLLMTDGLPELVNREGQMLGYDRAEAAFLRAARLAPDEIIEQLLEAAAAWAPNRSPDNRHQQEDDMTFVVIKVKQSVDDEGKSPDAPEPR